MSAKKYGPSVKEPAIKTAHEENGVRTTANVSVSNPRPLSRFDQRTNRKDNEISFKEVQSRYPYSEASVIQGSQFSAKSYECRVGIFSFDVSDDGLPALECTLPKDAKRKVNPFVTGFDKEQGADGHHYQQVYLVTTPDGATHGYEQTYTKGAVEIDPYKAALEIRGGLEGQLRAHEDIRYKMVARHDHLPAQLEAFLPSAVAKLGFAHLPDGYMPQPTAVNAVHAQQQPIHKK